MISMVFYILLFPVAFAFNLSIYSFVEYVNKDPEPLRIVDNKYEFLYHLDENLRMVILLKNNKPNVNASVFLTSRTLSSQVVDTVSENMTKCKQEENITKCINIRTTLTSPLISIGIQLYRGTTACATYIISEGNATLSNTTSKHSLCVSGICVMVIDVQNECEEPSAFLREPAVP